MQAVLSPNFLTFKEPKNRFQGTNSARWYENLIPTRFLAPKDCLKNPALGSPEKHVPPRSRRIISGFLRHMHVFYSTTGPPRPLQKMYHKAVYRGKILFRGKIGRKFFRNNWGNKEDHRHTVYLQMPIFRHPFFRKQCFALKYVLVAPPSKFLEVCLNLEYTVCVNEVQFTILILQCKGPKKASFRRCRNYLHLAKLRHTTGFTNVNAFILQCLTLTLLW